MTQIFSPHFVAVFNAYFVGVCFRLRVVADVAGLNQVFGVDVGDFVALDLVELGVDEFEVLVLEFVFVDLQVGLAATLDLVAGGGDIPLF